MSAKVTEAVSNIRACVIGTERDDQRWSVTDSVVGSGENCVALRTAAVVLRSLDVAAEIDTTSAPKVAAACRERGVDSVCILSIARADGRRMHWLDAEHARGWIEPVANGLDARSDPTNFARSIADALAAGFVGADAVLLACAGDSDLPRLSWGVEASFAPRSAARRAPASPPPPTMRHIGLYAIVDSSRQLHRVLDAGVRTVQLRIKRPPIADEGWNATLRAEIEASIAAARALDAELILNDHWKIAAELGITAVHLGQEDLLHLGDSGRAELVGSGVRLGISSHSVWELCRARSLDPRYIACGPVWPTTTKDMPWLPQGPDNLAWWCKHAGAPVVAIGGILEPEQARIAARTGADGVCLVRALGADPAATVPIFGHAIESGGRESDVARTATRAAVPRWPHPTLPPPSARIS